MSLAYIILPVQNSLSNPEAYAEAWQTCFLEKITVLKAVRFFDGVSYMFDKVLNTNL